jgi:hypothetical protein
MRMVVVAGLFLSFAGYNFIRAYDESVWFPPAAGTPPAHNVEAPINEGTSAQIKNGPLGTDNLSVTGNESITGYLTVSSTPNSVKITPNNISVTSPNPYVQFSDTDANVVQGISRLLYNNGSFLFQVDRNGDGTYDSPNPFTLSVGETVDNDYLIVPNQVRSSQYCDENGKNCFGAEEVSQSAAVLDNFGGMFSKGSSGDCSSQNPLTLACSCPAGYATINLAKNISGGEQYLYYCQANVKMCTVQFTTSANVAGNAVKTGNTTYSKTFPERTLIDVGQIYWGGSDSYPNAYMDARITAYLYNYSGMTSSGYSIQQGWWYDTTYKQYTSPLTTSGYSHPVKLLTVLSGNTVTSSFTTNWNTGAPQEQDGIGGTITATVTSCN